MACVFVAVVVELALFTRDVPTKYIAAGLAAALCLSLAWIQQEEDRRRLEALPEDIARRVFDAQKRRRGEDQNPAAKRAYIAWNKERERACVEEDNWGPHPTFRDRDFERVFRISRMRAESLMNLLGNTLLF